MTKIRKNFRAFRRPNKREFIELVRMFASQSAKYFAITTQRMVSINFGINERSDATSGLFRKIISCYSGKWARFIAALSANFFSRTCQTFFFDRKRTSRLLRSIKRDEVVVSATPKYQRHVQRREKCGCANVNVFLSFEIIRPQHASSDS